MTTADRTRARTAAGLLLFLAGAGILLGIITAEATYPAAYGTGRNTVSDLAAMRPENVVRQPSAAIFNSTMIVCGSLVAAAALLLRRVERHTSTTLALASLGVGMIGVGLFPQYHPGVHSTFALAAFLGGGLAAIFTAPMQSQPLRTVHVVLGLTALGALAVFGLLPDTAPVAALGPGGVERWIVYAIVLWLVVLGSTLAGRHPSAPAMPRPSDAELRA